MAVYFNYICKIGCTCVKIFSLAAKNTYFQKLIFLNNLVKNTDNGENKQNAKQ